MEPMTQHLDRPGGRIAFDVEGDGPLVVCSPGFGDLRQSFRLLRPQLVAAGYRVATMDLRGHGGSTVGWDDVSTTAIASDLVALIEHLGARSAAVISNSYSAGASLIAAHARPDLVVAQVLTGAAVRTPPSTFVTRLVVRLMRSPLGIPLWKAFFKAMHPGTRTADFAEYRSAVIANLSEEGRFATVMTMLSLGHDASAAIIGEVTAPSLVIMGTEDPDWKDPAVEASFIADALGGPARVELLAGIGHHPHAQAADDVARLATEFFGPLRSETSWHA